MRTALLTLAVVVALAIAPRSASTPQTSAPAVLPLLTGVPAFRAVELVRSLDRIPIVQERTALFGLPPVVVAQTPPAGTPLEQVLEVLLITTADATP